MKKEEYHGIFLLTDIWFPYSFPGWGKIEDQDGAAKCKGGGCVGCYSYKKIVDGRV
jgi:hypothetical protein